MTKWEGKLETKDSKDWHNITLYSFRLEGIDRWFRTGKTEVQQTVGQMITFDERNNKVVEGSVLLSQTTEESPVAETQPTLSASVPVSASADIAKPPSSGDIGRRIQWQAARADATRVMVAALQCDAMPWATNVAKSKKLDLLRGYITELTKQFIEEEV